jgi:LAO/AO transport system kinase
MMAGLVERMLQGEVRALARAISVVEDGGPGMGRAELLAACEAVCERDARRALRIGVTGPPGAGKSTLVDRLAREIRRSGRTVGVLAVDPTSPLTGGALLGDRIRMQAFADDAGVYIRSMASRGERGGLAAGVGAACRVLEAAGREVVVIETMGVGQDEVEVARLADVTVLVLVPGMGDGVQTLKAGVMEIADVYVVNKADMGGAEQVAAEIREMQGLGGEGAKTPVVRTVAATGEGVAELMGVIEKVAAGKESVAFQLRGGSAQAGDVDVPPGGSAVEKAQAPVGHAVVEGDDVAQEAGELGLGAGWRLDHLGIAVRSIAGARRLYEALGMRVTAEETVEQERVRTAMLPVGESRLELLEPVGEESVIGRFLAKRGEGLHHVALHCEDIDGVFARLKAEGVRLASEKVGVGAGGHRYFFVHPASAGGVLLEIVGDRMDGTA